MRKTPKYMIKESSRWTKRDHGSSRKGQLEAGSLT